MSKKESLKGFTIKCDCGSENINTIRDIKCNPDGSFDCEIYLICQDCNNKGTILERMTETRYHYER